MSPKPKTKINLGLDSEFNYSYRYYTLSDPIYSFFWRNVCQSLVLIVLFFLKVTDKASKQINNPIQKTKNIMENELLFSEHYKKKHEFNLKLKPTPIMTEYHPSTTMHNKHELITDLTSESNDKFNNLNSSSCVSQNTHNVVVKARKLLPILDDSSSNKTGYDHLMHFTTYKSASILNFAPTQQKKATPNGTSNGNGGSNNGNNLSSNNNNNFEIPAPALSRTLPKMSLVRNASQHNFATTTLNGSGLNVSSNSNGSVASTQLPAIKTNVISSLNLNTQTFASAPSKTINFTAEPSKLFIYLFYWIYYLLKVFC